jgi:hypothetical protein
MFPDGYAEPIARDPAFQRAQRLVALEFAPKSTQMMASVPAVMPSCIAMPASWS